MAGRWRRKWTRGKRCQDCGRSAIPTTVVLFWINGMKYRVCAGCIKAYRDRILVKHPPQD